MRFDKVFVKRLLILAVPIAFQQLLTQSMYLLDSLMIGTLGQNEIIAVAAAGQIVFMYNVFLYGVGTSATVFTSQFWGKKDNVGIRKTMSFTLIANMCVAIVFSAICISIPESILSIVNPTPEIVALGAPYLRVCAFAFPFSALTFAFNSSLKGMNKTRILMSVGIMTLLINGGINYTFIFGKLGMPSLGVVGAATGTAVAFAIECFVVASYYFSKKNPLGIRPKDLAKPDKQFVRAYVKTGAPIMLNESLWSIGNLLVVMLYNRLGLDMAGAMAVYIVVEKMCYILFSGIANSSAVLIGNRIGEGREDLAHVYAKRCLMIGPAIGIITGIIVILIGDPIMSLYKLTNAAQGILKTIFYCMPVTLPVSCGAFVFIAGVLRGGGDTRFAACTDIGTTYLVALPMAYIMGMLVKIPPPFVWLTYIICSEAVKDTVCFLRFRSRKWIHNITIPSGPEQEQESA